MPPWIIATATVLFGIVPATLLLLSTGLYYVSGVNSLPAGVTAVVDWAGVAEISLVAVAGLIGYFALFFAARARMSSRVAVALLLGVAALACAIASGWSPYWLGSPAIVGLAHVISYFLRHSKPGTAAV